ncbi:MAG: DUF1887 family CARF protein [Methyloprofundus sp.]|nr:DUF1887 family CARF protein [Methyloprofundus sp.]
MTKTTVHLLIVTGQTQANLIPVLQLKPDIIALAVSTTMRSKADDFIKLVKTLAHYDDKAIIRYDHVEEVALKIIEEKAMDIAVDLQERYPDCALTYHATGGTKLMTLGFCEVFRADGNQILYTDTEHARIEVVYPKNQAPIAIANLLTIDSYLQSMGKQYRNSAAEQWQQHAQQRKALTKWLAEHVEPMDNFWSVINGMVASAMAETVRGVPAAIAHPEQQFNQTPRGLWAQALTKMTEQQLCQWDQTKPDTLYFHDVTGAQYLGGQWLEEYVWHIASDLKPDDVKANVEFTEMAVPKDDIRNELDCVVVHHNRLLMVECKTVNFKKSTDKNADILYKLESLGHRAGGLYGTKWLISARPLDEPTAKRAKEYAIKVIYGAALKDLKGTLIAWMEAEKS